MGLLGIISDLILSAIPWTIAILAISIVGLIIYARWNYGYLERLGIPVVRPWLFFGSNYQEPYVDVTKQEIERWKKYGDVYGVYFGRTPQIYVCNSKLIRQISTVDFDHFVNHSFLDSTSSTDDIFKYLLDSLKDEQWKIVRNGLTPIFTSGKLKQLSTIAHSIGEDYWTDLLKQCADGGGRVSRIQFKEFIAPLVIEIVSKCFCGIEIPNARDPSNPFIQNMKAVLMHDMMKEDWKTTFVSIFPFMTKFFPMFPVNQMEFFLSALRNVLESREKSKEVGIDAANYLSDMLKKVRTDPDYKRLNITEMIVLTQGWEFFLAGYVGMRDSFEIFMYEMAANPDIQEMVYNEIQNIASKGEINLDATAKFQLLHSCLLEAIRLHTNFIKIDRGCKKDWEFEGLRIPKGSHVIFGCAAIHHNPEYYPDPETFDPNRFLHENKDIKDPYTFLAFGQGPRTCIGQRFAIEMLKVLLASFMLKFKIIKRSDTECKFHSGGAFIMHLKPIYLDVITRSSIEGI